MDFTSVEQVIADYFLSKKPALSIEQLAKKIAVSPASITRFSKKLALNNYKELIFLYNLSLGQGDIHTPVASSVTSSYHALATKSDSSYCEESIDYFCKALKEVKLIHFWGMGFNSYAGADFQFRFSRLGKFVRVISDQHSILMAANFADRSDVILIASLRGEDPELIKAMKIAKEKGAKLLLIIANDESEMIRYADKVLYAASLTKEESLGNISPQIPVLIQIDMIYTQYLNLYQSTVQKWVETEHILTDKKERRR